MKALKNKLLDNTSNIDNYKIVTIPFKFISFDKSTNVFRMLDIYDSFVFKILLFETVE